MNECTHRLARRRSVVSCARLLGLYLAQPLASRLELGRLQTESDFAIAGLARGLALDLGLAKTIEESGGGKTLQLMDPDGLVYSNYIISSIFMELDGGSDYDDK